MNELDKNTFPDDVWQGTESHPQCCFFELFPSSQDPYETFYGELFCHMDNTGESAKICKGDYCKCPLSNNTTDPRLIELDKTLTVNNRKSSYEKYYWLCEARKWLNDLFPELKERKE